MTTKRMRVHSQVKSTALNDSFNWTWSGAMINKVHVWEARMLRLTSRPHQSQLCRLFVPFWGRTTARLRSRASWGMAWDPNNCEWMVYRHGAVFLYSSLCGGEAVLTLGDVDIEDGVPGRVQVERGREEVQRRR